MNDNAPAEKPTPKRRGPKPGSKRQPKQTHRVRMSPEHARALIDDIERIAADLRSTRDALAPWIAMGQSQSELKLDAPILLLLSVPMDWAGRAHAQCVTVLDFLRGELEDAT